MGATADIDELYEILSILSDSNGPFNINDNDNVDVNDGNGDNGLSIKSLEMKSDNWTSLTTLLQQTSSSSNNVNDDNTIMKSNLQKHPHNPWRPWYLPYSPWSICTSQTISSHRAFHRQ